jgi:hypothetical protein
MLQNAHSEKRLVVLTSSVNTKLHRNERRTSNLSGKELVDSIENLIAITNPRIFNGEPVCEQFCKSEPLAGSCNTDQFVLALI